MLRVQRHAVQAAIVGACAVALVACGADSGEGGGANPQEGVQEDSVDYGLIVDITGPTAGVQVPFQHGIETQVKKANADGGVNGRKINLLVEDEKYEVDTGLAAYKKLVDQTPVVGMTALNNSSFQVAAIKQVDRNAVPIIGAESTAKQALTPFVDYFFGLQCTYAAQADVMIPYMIEKTGVDRPSVAVVSLDVESGYEMAGLVEERVNEVGGEFLGHLPVDPTATEADAQVQELRGQDPDFVVLHGSTATATILLKAMNKFGLDDLPVIGIFATGQPTAYQGVPESVGRNFETVNCYTHADVEESGTAEMKELAAQYGYEKDLATTDYVNGYVVGQVIVEALKKAGDDLSRESLHDAVASIEELDTGGLSEPVDFGEEDRAGILAVRPYRYNYDTKKIEAVGEYADYEELLSGAYLPEGVEP
jgi:branched-chain amino acid transport system substrate-binding protein